MMVIEHNGVDYVIGREGPAKISVRGIHNANGERISGEDYSFFRFADSDVIGRQITQMLEREAFDQGYKWRSDDQISFLTAQAYAEFTLYERLEEQIEGRA